MNEFFYHRPQPNRNFGSFPLGISLQINLLLDISEFSGFVLLVLSLLFVAQNRLQTLVDVDAICILKSLFGSGDVLDLTFEDGGLSNCRWIYSRIRHVQRIQSPRLIPGRVTAQSHGYSSPLGPLPSNSLAGVS